MADPPPLPLPRLLLDREGPVARALQEAGAPWEPRPEQLEMAGAVERALSSGRHLLVEAGTGVGKSFAYLVPLLCWSARTGRTVAVATSTIALQEQLVGRDLPLLARALPFEVSFALVKGRGNYLCTRRLELARGRDRALFDDPVGEELDRIAGWAAEGGTRSLQDLPWRPLPGTWDLVRAEQGNCKGRACPWYEPCAYQQARRRAHAVRCLVLNHHVLMADLALRRSGVSFLPEVGAVVVDEAHDLEDTAASHLGLRVSGLGILQVLGRLWQPRGRRGLLAARAAQALRREVEEVRQVARPFFGALGEMATRAGGPLRVGEEFPLEDPLSGRLLDLAQALLEGSVAADDEDVALEWRARAASLDDQASALAGIVAGRPGEVRWIEAAARGGAALASAPVDLGPLLHEALWQAHESVVLTSATLATGRPPSFVFAREKLGLGEADEMAVGSPFDYRRQVVLRLRPDLPDPVRAPSDYEAALPEAVLEAVRHTRGGAFVLFTGYGSMRRVAEALGPILAAEGMTVLVQGEDLPRDAMLRRFREENAVLFGVASFWQGVDVPGPRLRHVVIARLPFEVPTDPLQQARAERVTASGRDAFRTLSLPAAALRLKQGFGRLVRRSSDEGVVTILDPRIANRAYGRMLLASLPECATETVAARPGAS